MPGTASIEETVGQAQPTGAEFAGTPLAVRLPNWVGDVCMALPTLACLRSWGFDLHCFGRGWAADLLAGLPYAVGKLPTGTFAAAAAIKACGARRGVLFTNSFGSAWQMWWASVRAVGYRNEFRSFMLAEPVQGVPGGHEVEAFWRLGQVFVHTLPGKTAGPERRASTTYQHGEPLATPPPARLDLRLADRHRAEAAAALTGANVGGPYTVICPLATGLVRGRSKQWPSFPLLCRLVVESGGTSVACPGPGEKDACAALVPGARLLPGLGLGAYAAVLAGAQRVVANDSGPMHLAAAVDAPVLGIFGVSDPGRTRPWSATGRTIGDSRGWPTAEAVWAELARLPQRSGGGERKA
jgi:heptosyltransferase-2